MSAPTTGDPAADLAALLDQLTGPPPPPPEPALSTGPEEPGEATAEPLYGDVRQFVQEYLIHVVERRIAIGGGSGVFWCAKWWAHAEALSRVYALWRSWESLRVADPATGMSVWWRDHLDPHLAQLTHSEGPFSRCQPTIGDKPGKHYEPAPLPVDPMPDEVLAQFPDGEHTAAAL